MHEDRTVRLHSHEGKKCKACGNKHKCLRIRFRKHICIPYAAAACGITEFEFSLYRVR